MARVSTEVAQQQSLMNDLDDLDDCTPECASNNGVCVDAYCFCRYPFTGATCSKEMKIEFKFTSMTLLAAMLIFLIFGLLLMLFLKLICDNICCRERQYSEFDEDMEDVEVIED